MPLSFILSSPKYFFYSSMGKKKLSFAVLLAIVSCLLFFSGCRRAPEDFPLTPPTTHLLARDFIGYGVVTDSFSHILNEPGPQGVSLGHLRRGTVIRIIERRPFSYRNNMEFWVLAEGNYEGDNASQGWLQENGLLIYDTESQARTASRSLNL